MECYSSGYGFANCFTDGSTNSFTDEFTNDYSNRLPNTFTNKRTIVPARRLTANILPDLFSHFGTSHDGFTRSATNGHFAADW